MQKMCLRTTQAMWWRKEWTTANEDEHDRKDVVLNNEGVDDAYDAAGVNCKHGGDDEDGDFLHADGMVMGPSHGNDADGLFLDNSVGGGVVGREGNGGDGNEFMQ